MIRDTCLLHGGNSKQKTQHTFKVLPVAQNQNLECVYLGGNKKIIAGIAMHGTMWNIMHNRRSSKVLKPTKTSHSTKDYVT